MSINKNFVVKNGFEVNTDLLLADATTKRVGIATTQPGYTLDVAGGIGVTNLYVSGISTFSNEFYVRNGSNTTLSALGVGGSVGVGTALPAYLLDIRSPVSTGQTALYVQGDVRLTGDLLIDDLTVDLGNFNNLTVDDTLYVTGITTLRNDLNVGGATTTTHLRVIGVSTIGSLSASGITTITNNVNISGVTTTQHLRVTGVSTIASLSASGITTITNNVNIAGVTTTQHLRVTGVSTIASLSASGITTITNNVNIAGVTTTQHLLVTGISTIGTGVTITSGGNINAVSGVVTATRFVGSGSSLTGNARNLTATIGIGTTGGVVGYAVSFVNFVGPSISTTLYNSNAGIATIFFIGERGNVSMSVTSIAPSAGIENGDLWFNVDDGRTYLYYDEAVVGSGSDAYWVDASPFNVGILTEVSLSFVPGSAVSPSWYFDNSVTTGVFSPVAGQITFVSAGSSILNINSGVSTFSSNLSVAGVTTSRHLQVIGFTTISNESVTGVSTIGTLAVSGVTTTQHLRVTGVTTAVNISVSGITTTGTLSVSSVTGTQHLQVTGVTTTANINAGIVTATEFDVSASTFNPSGINVVGVITASSDIKIGANSVATTGKAIAMAIVFGG
jgi:uncharacterized protein YunC (DUF1805 family)